MFTNSGSKIRTVAIVFFWVTVVVSAILAFSLGWTRVYSRYGDYTEFNSAIFFGFLIGVPALSYISTLFLVAFGDLVDDMHNAKKAIEKMSKEESK